MKLFQQLLVAPAALGLLAPLAANAAEVNINNVVDYANPSAASVTSAQFSDVVPGDWAYTALQNLSDSYGCVDNAYTQSLNNGQALTRYEAAALINACLDSGFVANSQGFSSDAARLADEFGSEMAILKGRVDGLEYKLNEFEAGQFASSTKLSGEATFLVGGVDYDADASNDGSNAHALYAFELGLDTSFTGQDSLVVGIETGNTTSTDRLTTDSSVTPTTAGELSVSSLYYQFPLGDFTVAAGPLLDQDDLVATTTSTYSNDSFFGALYLGPNALSANDQTGAGVSVAWNSDSGLNAGVSIVSPSGNSASAGLWNEDSNEYVTLSLGYDGDGFGGGIIYHAADSGETIAEAVSGQTLDAWEWEQPYVLGIGAYWNAFEGFDISAGCDLIQPNANVAVNSTTEVEEATTCAIGADLEIGAGTLSGAIAQVPAWNTTSGAYDEAGTSYELSYSYQVNDGVTITPGIYTTAHDSNFVDHTIFAVETTFKF
jgi:hypothetical protein